MLICEPANTSFIDFDLTRLEIEPTSYCPRDEHNDLYTTDAVAFNTPSNMMLFGREARLGFVR